MEDMIEVGDAVATSTFQCGCFDMDMVKVTET